jgi:hypothetical protein
MTKTEKANKLNRLDEMLLNKMIEIMDSGNTEMLPELASVSNYLAKNQMVAEKEKSSIEEDNKKRVKEAEKRRAAND